MKRTPTIVHRFFTAPVQIMGGGTAPLVETNWWHESLHVFGAGVPIHHGAITSFDLFIAEIYPAKGAPVATAWATASMSDAQLARILAGHIQKNSGRPGP